MFTFEESQKRRTDKLLDADLKDTTEVERSWARARGEEQPQGVDGGLLRGGYEKENTEREEE